MKFKKLITVGAFATSAIAIPLMAVSCQKTSTEESSVVVPIQYAFKNTPNIHFSSEDNNIPTYIVNFENKNPFVIEYEEEDTVDNYFHEARIESANLLFGDEPEEFENDLRKLGAEIAEKVKNDFTLTYTENDSQYKYLLPYIENFAGIPKEFRVIVKNSNGKNVPITYVLDSASQMFDQWLTGMKLGVKGQSNQDAALKLTNIDVVTSFTYKPYINENTFIKGGLSVVVENKQNKTIDPILESYNTEPNAQTFKKMNIDWAKMNPNTYFDAKITLTKDGDTFDVAASEDKKGLNNIGSVNQSDSYTIRLLGIDTPEKAVGANDKFVQSAPFEYAFALMPTHFAKKLWDTYGQNVRVAYIEGFDGTGGGRITADVFFGPDYQYSYNVEVVRAGFTLPMSKETVTENNYDNDKNSYEGKIYPQLAIAMHDAIENHRGFFHYFEKPIQVSNYIYLIKPNTSYKPFEKIYDKEQSKEKTESN
ncbi:thermonuclease family protein [Mycoplasma sp. Z463D]